MSVAPAVCEELQSPGIPPGQLWRERNFSIFWGSRSLDAIGDAFAMIALPLLVFDATGSVTQMGLVTGIMGFGNLASGLFFGSAVDRYDRRKLIILCDVGRAATYTLVPLVWWLSGPSIALIYIVAVATAYLSTSVLITSTAIITNVVRQEQIVGANGLVQSTTALAFVLGPMLAGFTSKWVGAASSIVVITLLYGVSAIQMLFVRLRARAGAAQTDKGIEAGRRFESLLGGLRHALADPVLRAVLILLAIFALLAEGVIDLVIFHLRHDLSQSDSATGFVFGIASLGAILGGWLVPALRRKWGFGVCFIFGLILQGIAVATIGLASSGVLIAELATAFTFANTIMRVNTMSLRQQITPDRLLGRVSSLFSIAYTVPGAIGAAIASMIAHRVGPGPVLVVCGVLIIVVASVGTLSSARAKWPERAVVPVG
jgi:MFS family permease